MENIGTEKIKDTLYPIGGGWEPPLMSIRVTSEGTSINYVSTFEGGRGSKFADGCWRGGRGVISTADVSIFVLKMWLISYQIVLQNLSLYLKKYGFKVKKL